MKYLILSIALLLSGSVAYCQQPRLLIGTYTKGKSEGIYVYDFDKATGAASYISHVKSSNPSYLAVHRSFVFAVNEDDSGMVSSYSFHNDKLELNNSLSSLGRHPCYISTYTDGKGLYLMAGNYSSGNLVSMQVVPGSGMILRHIQNIPHSGSSVNPQRQTSPHVHACYVSPDARYVFVTDLGTDKIVVYKAIPRGSYLELAEEREVKVTPGAGPRHLDMSRNGKFVYLMEELTGIVQVFRVKNKGRLKSIQRISAQLQHYTGAIGSADIHVSPDGRFVYASNRGDANNIAIFRVGRKGKLTLAGFQDVLGKKPRNFNFDPSGNFLLVANQASDEVVIFRRDLQTGLLTYTGNRISVGNPVCLKWIE